MLNNAVIALVMTILADPTVTMFDKMVSVSLRGPWYLSSRIAPKMGDCGGGCMINVLSIVATISPPYTGLNFATNSTLDSLTKVIAQEWSYLNIRANVIASGSYRSGMTDSAMEKIKGYEKSLIHSTLISRVAYSRAFLTPVI